MLSKAWKEQPKANEVIVHTGQHYDNDMSDVFFDELELPKPNYNLSIGSGTHGKQTGRMLESLERVIIKEKPDWMVVYGDTNSTLAGALAASKLHIPVAHVEAGLRSFNRKMPEEINRIVTDSITNWFFTTSEQANNNLRNAGISEERIFFVGNTMIDTLKANFDRLRPPALWNVESLEPKQYFVLTLHRPNNVDEQEKLVAMLNAISEGTRGRKVIFPVHPRTAKMLKELDSELPGFVYAEPMGYLEFNYLVKNCMAVITDSGGITEEATVMGVPCLTLRDTTERPETVTVGTNELVGTDPSKLKPVLDRVFSGQWKKGGIPEKWDGKTGERIVAHLDRLLSS